MIGRNLIVPPLLSVMGMAMFVAATGLCRPPRFTLAERLAGVAIALLAYAAGFMLASREENQQRRETNRRSLPRTASSDPTSGGVLPGTPPPAVIRELQPSRTSPPHLASWISAAEAMHRTRSSPKRRQADRQGYERSH